MTQGVSRQVGRILIADDDRAIRESLNRALTLEGYETVAVADGAAVLEELRHRPADLIVLDLMMPNIDGITVCRVLRTEKDATPILILTARTETSDRVEGLDAGADDYLAKPFALDELLARIRALLRRHSRDDEMSSVLVLDNLVVDVAARRVRRGIRDIELSKTEFDLLELLVRNHNLVLDHSTIYDRIWGYDFGPESKNLAVYIGYIRRKIDTEGEKRLIHTVRGVGYSARVMS